MSELLDYRQMQRDLYALHATEEELSGIAPLELGDNKVIAVASALGRATQLLTGSIMTDDTEDHERWFLWSDAIAMEWDFDTPIRQAIAEGARENANCDHFPDLS